VDLCLYPSCNPSWHGQRKIYIVRMLIKHILTLQGSKSGPGSVVGIATAYGLDGPGIESRWGEIFRTSPDRP